jgi:hypothetical protein
MHDDKKIMRHLQHTSAYVSIRQHTMHDDKKIMRHRKCNVLELSPVYIGGDGDAIACLRRSGAGSHTLAACATKRSWSVAGSIRQHTSAYVSILWRHLYANRKELVGGRSIRQMLIETNNGRWPEHTSDANRKELVGRELY